MVKMPRVVHRTPAGLPCVTACSNNSLRSVRAVEGLNMHASVWEACMQTYCNSLQVRPPLTVNTQPQYGRIGCETTCAKCTLKR